MQTSAGGLAESSLYIWYSDDPLGVVSSQGDCLVPLPFATARALFAVTRAVIAIRRDQERDEVVHVCRAETGDRVPASSGFDSLHAHEIVAARCAVVACVAAGASPPD